LKSSSKKTTDLNFSTLKPFSRKFIVQQAALYDSLRSGNPALQLTKVDEYNLRSLYMNNSEWFTGNSDDFASKKPVLKTFYKTKSNLFEVNNKDFFLAINPVIQIQYGKESDNDERLFLNSRGCHHRGRIANNRFLFHHH
jgi:hypothetical protein